MLSSDDASKCFHSLETVQLKPFLFEREPFLQTSLLFNDKTIHFVLILFQRKIIKKKKNGTIIINKIQLFLFVFDTMKRLFSLKLNIQRMGKNALPWTRREKNSRE